MTDPPEEQKATLRASFVPNYEGMAVLEDLTDQIVTLYEKVIDAVILNGKNLGAQVVPHEGKLVLQRANLDILTTYPDPAKMRPDLQVLVDDCAEQGVKVSLFPYQTEEYLEGVGKRTNTKVPSVILYASQELKEILG